MRSKIQHHVPLLGPAVSLMAGITVMSQCQLEWPLWPLLAGCVLVTLLTMRWPVVQTLVLMLDFMLVGMLVTQHLPPPVDPHQSAEALIVSEPVKKTKTMAVDLLLADSGQRIRRYLWKDERSRTLQLGDQLVLRQVHDGYVPSRDWQRGGHAYEHVSRVERVRLHFLLMRHQLLSRYHQSATDEEAYAVLAAMTLGDKSALTPSIRETYSVSGASHVLALSGLHLGIIYMILTWLMLGRRRFWLSQVLVVLCVWAFTFLTGLSPSLVRSAVMISIYSVFSVGGRHHSSVNLLCFTAIVMLIADPASLFDVGFQLSFMAVLSILLFVPLFQQLLTVHSWPLRWIYGMVCVSVAAQLGVAPLIAFYFGRFSTYFLLTNFIVIPSAIVILSGALLVLVFPSLGSVLLEVVSILNKALGWVSQLPCSSIDDLHPSVLRVCILYVLVFCIYLVISLASARYHSG